MAQVFISYAKKDYIAPDGGAIPGNFVDRVIDALSRAGISYWLDREQLAGGETYAERIARNIKECDVFLFLSTEAANASEWTRREIGTAVTLGKRIIPVRLDDSPYDDAVNLYLSSIQYIDARELGQEEALRRIVEQVKHPFADSASSIEYGKLPQFTTIVLYAALVVLTVIYALLTYLFLWSKTLQSSEVIGGIVGFVGETALLLSIYYVLRMLRKRHCVFLLPVLIIGLMLCAAFLTNRPDLFICAGLLFLGWGALGLVGFFQTPTRKSFFAQMSKEQTLMKLNDPENLILVYLVFKCAIVVVGHWFEGFMNLARFLETFRY
ncbi:MAG: toll/interleukin-1 receptor domain-containing protein [Bacteroidales bacterium]|nr:toll/interleukin-1 receptor domain-containing protein [Bacteroidales bacterium]